MQILVVDLGSQYTTLIGRSLRDLGVRSIILPPAKAMTWIDAHRDELKGIILSGGAASINELAPEDLPSPILAVNRPILGICLGMHWIARAFGGAVAAVQEQRGYGPEEVEILAINDPLLRRVARARNTVWMSHGDSVINLPPGFERTARGTHGEIAAMSSRDGMVFGVQFHPEVTETECGSEILSGFLELCETELDWEPANIIAGIREEVAKAVAPEERAILAFSGGVDSSTLTAIVGPVLGDRLTCIAFDHGGLRRGEEREIMANAVAAGCGRPGDPSFTLIECREDFLGAVSAVGTDAEVKRRWFRKVYSSHLEVAAVKHGASVLIQGTLAPDVIESGARGAASVIVTHHNVGLRTSLRQLHPLSGLFKYEVRELARSLGLPPSIAERKPFPGPGLYCRIVGAPVTAELLETVRWADAEVQRIVADAGIEREFDQLVVALLAGSPVAGIKGDGRAYGPLVVVRAVQTSDFMTARGYRFPPNATDPRPIWKQIEKALTKHPGIVGVVPDETDKPPRRTEFE